ncbi:unnamed protein product, partial [Iphiclides podalirius]
MQLEIPECRRCFCCLPLRCGIIAFGYLYLIFSLFVLSLETWLAVTGVTSTHTMALYRGVSFYTQLWFFMLLYVIEAVFSIVLLIGAHGKKPRLLRVYFYYGITTTLASLVTLLSLAHHYANAHWANSVLEGSLAFCGFALQAYLLLLIRTELKKLRQNSQISFINHVAEVVVDVPRDEEAGNPL